MNPSTTIRDATPGDADELVRLLRGFDSYLNALATEPQLPLPPGHFERIRGLAFGPDPVCHVLVAEAEGQLVGHLCYHWGAWFEDMAPMLFIVDLYVEADARGRGTGRAFVEEALRRAHERGCARVVWTVWRENREAMAFYERLGAAYIDQERLMCLTVGAPV